MEKESIIKKAKTIWEAIWYHIKVCVKILSGTTCLIFFGIVPWLYLGKMLDEIIEMWNEGNLLYIPDLLEFMISLITILGSTIVAVICDVIIGYIIIKLIINLITNVKKLLIS